MSEKEFERNLDYGDCNNTFCFLGDFLVRISEKIENTIDKIIK